MTKRNIENRLSELESDTDDDPLRVIIERSCYGSDGDESYTYEKVIEIGGN